MGRTLHGGARSALKYWQALCPTNHLVTGPDHLMGVELKCLSLAIARFYFSLYWLHSQVPCLDVSARMAIYSPVWCGDYSQWIGTSIVTAPEKVLWRTHSILKRKLYWMSWKAFLLGDRRWCSLVRSTNILNGKQFKYNTLFNSHSIPNQVWPMIPTYRGRNWGSRMLNTLLKNHLFRNGQNKYSDSCTLAPAVSIFYCTHVSVIN